MLMVLFIVGLLIAYCVPGLFVARGLYTKQVKAINAQPATVVPPKPPRPRIKVDEMLHQKGPTKTCNLHDGDYAYSCNCKWRNQWIELKNQWIDYNGWMKEWGHVKNGVSAMPEPDLKKCLLSVPGWPVVMAASFIKNGAKNIPDYAYIERMENELRELD